MGYLAGIDVGGTFTDFVLVRPDGEVVVAKSPTTPHDEATGVLEGLARVARLEDRTLAELLAATDVIVHATTTADNTLIELTGEPTGLITTEGHRDEIELRRGWKESIWDPTVPAPPAIAKRRFRIGVKGRLDYKGNVLEELDEEGVRRAARRFRDHGISSVAVVLLYSFLDPTWEKRVRDIVLEEYPDARVSLSHEVMPAAPEFERTSTTLVNAFVGPQVVDYLGRLTDTLRQAGYSNQLLIMQSNGGIATVDAVMHRPIATLASGPVGGVTGAAAVAREAGSPDFIAVDMGGTSYDVSLVRGGTPEVKSHWNWVHRFCLALPIVDVLSIGAGGGSIASVKAGGLTVGPESAAADPGPICYGRGGTRVTVTDANVLLGYVNPDSLCGGEFVLDAGAVEDAMREQIAEPLGLGVLEAAAGIHRVVNANMNNAIRKVSCERGHDPRKFDLVAFGGNGPVHAGGQALELGIGRIVVPRPSPVLSAFGVLTADFVVNQVRAHVSEISLLDADAVTHEIAQMRLVAEKELANANLPEGSVHHAYHVACRYPGQTFTISVPIELDGEAVTPSVVESIEERFHALHETLHSFAQPDEPIVVAELQVRSSGAARAPDLPHPAPPESATPEPSSQRQAWFDGAMVSTPVFGPGSLGVGHSVTGPAIVDETFTTIVVGPQQTLSVDELGNYLVTTTGGDR